MPTVDYQTIEPDGEGGFWLVNHGEYAASSVLAGQSYRGLVVHYESLEEAIQENPEAEVLDHSTKDPFAFLDKSPLPESPLSWFDTADAGELWHEDDY